MRVHDALHYCHAESGALCFCREERFEDSLPLLARHARTLVANIDLQCRVPIDGRCTTIEVNASSLRRNLLRILKDIHKDLFEPGAIDRAAQVGRLNRFLQAELFLTTGLGNVFPRSAPDP
jgi:hypothetical protein